jgi:hypothetical protein
MRRTRPGVLSLQMRRSALVGRGGVDCRLPVVMDVVIRPAGRDVEDAEQFARYFDVAGNGLMRWMVGKRFTTPVLAYLTAHMGRRVRMFETRPIPLR